MNMARALVRSEERIRPELSAERHRCLIVRDARSRIRARAVPSLRRLLRVNPVEGHAISWIDIA